MYKKLSLRAARFLRATLGCLLLGGLAMPAAAVMREPSGRGEVLLLPYYTVQAGHQTLLSIVNHTNSGKAVKVRFREGRNGREAYAFNLYLGEFDVWTAALFAADANSEARLLTFDQSCTVPEIRTSSSLPRLPDGSPYAPFSTRDFSAARADGGPADASRTREGYVEIIEMGALVNNSDFDLAATTIGGVPTGCARLAEAWNAGGTWRTAPATDLQPPRGGLSGTATILAVADGALYSTRATALGRFSVVVQHGAPESALPDLSSAITDPARERVEAVVADRGQVYRSHWPQAQAIDAVTAVLMQSEVGIQYEIDPAIDARSDWILSFPTRRHYVDPALAPGSSMPFPAPVGNLASCLRITEESYRFFDREQAGPRGMFGPIGNPRQLELCRATQAVSISAPGSLLGSESAVLLPTQLGSRLLLNGHVSLPLLGGTRPALGGEQYLGLPVIGFRAFRYRNTAARPGELGIYTGAEPQSGRSYCLVGRAPCAPL